LCCFWEFVTALIENECSDFDETLLEDVSEPWKGLDSVQRQLR
jgi:hypothetical protein